MLVLSVVGLEMFRRSWSGVVEASLPLHERRRAFCGHVDIAMALALAHQQKRPAAASFCHGP